MYFGSMRFYKHLIYFFLMLLIFLIGIGLYKLFSSHMLSFTSDVQYALAQHETSPSEILQNTKEHLEVKEPENMVGLIPPDNLALRCRLSGI